MALYVNLIIINFDEIKITMEIPDFGEFIPKIYISYVVCKRFYYLISEIFKNEIIF